MNNTFTARSNPAVMDENYDLWCRDPLAVEPLWAAFFEGFELGSAREEGTSHPAPQSTPGVSNSSWQTRVDSMVYAYRSLGHTLADLDPLGILSQEQPLLTLAALGFEESDLVRSASSHFYKGGQTMPLRQSLSIFKIRKSEAGCATAWKPVCRSRFVNLCCNEICWSEWRKHKA